MKIIEPTDDSLDAVVRRTMEIIEAHEFAAEMDAGFDGGEFSGPAHAKMERREIEELAKSRGYTYEQVMERLNVMQHEASFLTGDAPVQGVPGGGGVSEHNHPWVEPTDGQLYHPDCDPRKLADTCPACREIMLAWGLKVDQMVREGV